MLRAELYLVHSTSCTEKHLRTCTMPCFSAFTLSWSWKHHLINLKEESHKEYLLYLVLNILRARLGNSVADIFLHSCTLSPRKEEHVFSNRYKRTVYLIYLRCFLNVLERPVLDVVTLLGDVHAFVPDLFSVHSLRNIMALLSGTS